MYGQTPETALSTALAAINFAMQQQDLSFQFQSDRMQKKMTKLHEQCKRKLQELHNGYQAVTNVLQPVVLSLSAGAHVMHLAGCELLQVQALSLAQCIHACRSSAGCQTTFFVDSARGISQQPEADQGSQMCMLAAGQEKTGRCVTAARPAAGEH